MYFLKFHLLYNMIEVVKKTCRNRKVKSSYPISFSGGELYIEAIELRWKIGDIIDPSLPPIKSIARDPIKKDEFTIIFSEENKTMMFILPLIFKDKLFLKYDDFIMWAYIDHKLNYIYLGVKLDDSPEYYTLERNLCKHELFDSQNKESDYLMLFKFNINLTEDILTIIAGKYSQISDDSKIKIIEFHKFKQPKNSLVYGVLYRTNSRREELEQLLNVTIEEESELLGEFQSNDSSNSDKYAKLILNKDIYESI